MNEPNETSPVDYERTGKVDWAAFLPWAALALLVSAGLAFGMNFLFHHDLYYVAIVPIFAGLICAGMVVLAIHKGNCRSALIGLMLGLIAGAESLAGYYYAGMIWSFGPEMGSRLDLLPKYITLRMKTDMRDNSGQAFRRGPNPIALQFDIVQFGDRLLVVPKRGLADVAFNWIFFAMDTCIVVLLPAGAGFVRARRGFCENCHRWQSMEQAIFPYGHGTDIAEIVISGNLSGLQFHETIAMPQKGSYTSLAVEYCRPDEGQAPTCPAYVSVKDVRMGGGMGQINQFEAAPGKRRLHRFLISRDQITQLTGRLPALSVVVGKSAAQAASVPAAAQASDAARPTAIAEISPIEDPFAGKILSKSALILGSNLTMAIVPLFFGSMMMALGGIYLCTDEAKNEGWPPILTDNAPFIVALGAVLFPASVYIGLRSPNIFGEWYFKKRAMSEIRSRPNWIVDPDDPDAIFVQIVPRCNWGRVMLETASDVGFLKLDENRREILFEGDKERYRIRTGHDLLLRRANRVWGGNERPYDSIHHRAPRSCCNGSMGESNRPAR